mgnify:CR=1 FL=1
MKKLLAMLLAGVMVFGLAACGSKDDAPADGDQPEDVGFTGSYLMGTGSATGNYYNFGNAVCTVVNQKTGANLTVNATGGSTENARLLGAGENEFAMIQSDVYSYAHQGIELFDGTPITNFKAVTACYPEMVQIVVRKDSGIQTVEDMRGKNVCVPVQNPTFIFQYLCEKNGLTVGTDITIDNTYAQPAELNTALASGEVHIAVLPEPMVTIARAANPALTVALDLTAEWDKVAPAGSLVQGCVVVRKAFADEHPNEVKAFLAEYQASIEYLTAEPDQAGQMIEDAGIFAKAAVAAKAIPNCNVCFVSGADMQAALTEFLTALSTVAPQSIGGSVPGDDFYCILK